MFKDLDKFVYFLPYPFPIVIVHMSFEYWNLTSIIDFKSKKNRNLSIFSPSLYAVPDILSRTSIERDIIEDRFRELDGERYY